MSLSVWQIVDSNEAQIQFQWHKHILGKLHYEWKEDKEALHHVLPDNRKILTSGFHFITVIIINLNKNIKL